MEDSTKVNQNEINISNYLVTTGVDVNEIKGEKIQSDLDQLTKAEEKISYKADIAKGILNPKIKRAVSALKLSNPFKGY